MKHLQTLLVGSVFLLLCSLGFGKHFLDKDDIHQRARHFVECSVKNAERSNAFHWCVEEKCCHEGKLNYFKFCADKNQDGPLNLKLDININGDKLELTEACALEGGQSLSEEHGKEVAAVQGPEHILQELDQHFLNK